MKPKLSHYQVEFWTCWNSEHRHKTEDVAAQCIAKFQAKKPRDRPRTPEERLERELVVTIGVLRGDTFREAGQKVGVGVARARALFHQSLLRVRRRLPAGDWNSITGDVQEARDDARLIPEVRLIANEAGISLPGRAL